MIKTQKVKWNAFPTVEQFKTVQFFKVGPFSSNIYLPDKQSRIKEKENYTACAKHFVSVCVCMER